MSRHECILIHCFPNVLTSRQEGDKQLRPFSVFFIVRGTGVCLNKSHTSGTALQGACPCLTWGYILKIGPLIVSQLDLNIILKSFSTCTNLKSTECKRQLDCMWSERCQREQKRRWSGLTKVRLDRRRIHGEESSVAYGRSISVELDSGISIVQCTKKRT